MTTTECTLCTVPTDRSDGTCAFCADYAPPAPADAVTRYSAVIKGGGPTSGHQLDVDVDPEAPRGPAAFIDCDGEVMLDADGLLRLAVACQQAGERLRRLGA